MLGVYLVHNILFTANEILLESEINVEDKAKDCKHNKHLGFDARFS